MRNMTPSLWVVFFLKEKWNKFDDRLVFKSDSPSRVHFVEARLSSLLPGSSRWQAPDRKVVEKFAICLVINKACEMDQVFVLLHLVFFIFEYRKVLWRFT